MKTPDKIYRTTTYLDNDKGKVVYKKEPVKGAENIEYICKDSILDRLKTQQDKCVYRSTYWDFYQAIITEIKAL